MALDKPKGERQTGRLKLPATDRWHLQGLESPSCALYSTRRAAVGLKIVPSAPLNAGTLSSREMRDC
jgi:hypothetical protein